MAKGTANKINFDIIVVQLPSGNYVATTKLADMVIRGNLSANPTVAMQTLFMALANPNSDVAIALDLAAADTTLMELTSGANQANDRREE